MVVPRTAAWLAATAVLLGLAHRPGAGPGAPGRPSDYDADLARLEGATAGGGAASVLLLVERAALTGDPRHSRAAAVALDEALARRGPAPELLLARADLELRHHRLPEARRILDQLQPLAGRPAVETLRADIALQEGRYEEAGRAYAALLDRQPSWETLARLAHLESLRGNAAAADRLFAEAEDELTAKQMRALAWLELQRGRLDLDHGRAGEAEAHYRRAGRAYSGYWRVEEHRAELLAVQERFGEAAALYERLAARTPRPELLQALGDLYAFMGEPERAAPWHERALAAYLESASRGEVQYLHHLADFYADVRRDGPEALRWARRDLELRRTVPALAGVAWALYRAGQVGEARRAMEQALAPGLADAHLLSRAGIVHFADGRDQEGDRLLARAAALNPSYARFHAHH
jgi:tetratricopeptide (TPR) repeat protein